MKRTACLLLCGLLLCGCRQTRSELDRFMELRSQLLSSKSCSFSAVVTADYGEKTVNFDISCEAQDGNLKFTVTGPESIAGIAGEISQAGGKLSFSETVLAFEPLAEGNLSPVSAPWILLRALRGGCVTACGQEAEFLRVSVDDSYAEDALHLDVWLDGENRPVQAEIRQEQFRILSLKIENFQI